MGSLKAYNDKIWKVLLHYTSNLTDNVYIQIIVLTVFVCVLWFVLNYFLQYKRNKLFIPFGPISMLFCMSTGYMIDRLPMIHERLHRALSISSSVIESSKTYLMSFERSANIVVNSSSDIVTYLYFLDEIERKTWTCNPSELYESLFRTFDKIRGGFILPDVHLSSFGTLSIPFILCIFIIIIMGIIIFCSSTNKYRLAFYILQSLFLIYTTSISNGTFFAATLLWVSEEIGYGILNTKI